MNPFVPDTTAAPACTCLIDCDVCPRHFPAAHFLGMRTAPNEGPARVVPVPLIAPGPLVFDPENYGVVSIEADWVSTPQTFEQLTSLDPVHTGPETIEITPSGRTIHAEMGAAIFRPAKTSPGRPEIGPLELLLASAQLIPLQPTTEQWQTLKQAILELPHAH